MAKTVVTEALDNFKRTLIKTSCEQELNASAMIEQMGAMLDQVMGKDQAESFRKLAREKGEKAKRTLIDMDVHGFELCCAHCGVKTWCSDRKDEPCSDCGRIPSVVMEY